MPVVDERGERRGRGPPCARRGRPRSRASPARPAPRRTARQARTSSSSGACRPGEEAVDAIEEARLVDAAGGRQDRPGRPLDPVGQRPLGELRVAQPPLRLRLVADADQGRMVVTPQLLADERWRASAARRPRCGREPADASSRRGRRRRRCRIRGRAELGHDGGNDPGQAGRLAAVAEKRRDGTLDAPTRGPGRSGGPPRRPAAAGPG